MCAPAHSSSHVCTHTLILTCAHVGPASVTLYPDLIHKLDRVLIYNGDADTCVPYVGNEEVQDGSAARVVTG